MERLGIEYLANAFWQLPLLAAGAWLLLRLWKPAPATQYRVWLCVLMLSLLLPLRGVVPAPAPHTDSPAAAFAISEGAAYSPSLAAPPASPMSPTAFTSGMYQLRLNAAAIDCILCLWLAAALFGLARLAWAWRTAYRLVRDSRAAVFAGRETVALVESAQRLGVKIPRVHESARLAGPVVIGAVRPVLLWPAGLAHRSNDELMAALSHEMAHIRRHDYALNLLCRVAALPLHWHPALYAVERRILATREMACDALAAQAMDSETTYAACLLSLAQSMVGLTASQSLAAGLFNGNVMEERMMQLTQNTTPMNWRARTARLVAGATAMTAAIALAAAFHVVPAMAQTSASHPASQPQAATPPTAAAPQSAAPAALMPVTRERKIAPKVAKHAKNHVDKPLLPIDGQIRDLTPEERARIETQLEEAQTKIAAATAKINSPEFQKQIADAQKNVLQAQILLNSAEFRQKMADAPKRIDQQMAKLNSPEFRQKIQAKIDATLNNEQFRQQMADAQKQIAETTARLNTPAFRKQIEDQVFAVTKINSAQMQKQMADADKQIADALARMKAEQENEKPK